MARKELQHNISIGTHMDWLEIRAIPYVYCILCSYIVSILTYCKIKNEHKMFSSFFITCYTTTVKRD